MNRIGAALNLSNAAIAAREATSRSLYKYQPRLLHTTMLYFVYSPFSLPSRCYETTMHRSPRIEIERGREVEKTAAKRRNTA
jgi:hypothetical protein